MSVLVVADVELGEQHKRVLSLLWRYLRQYGGVERVHYVLDPQDGPDRAEPLQRWWRRALADPRLAQHGCLVVVAGPAPEPGQQRRQPGLADLQLAELTRDRDCYSEQVGAGQAGPGQPAPLSLQSLVNQRRVAVVRFPYSDLSTLPAQVGLETYIWQVG